MSRPYVAVGFLFHRETRRVLLHRRGVDAPSYPDQWHMFGGHGDDADGGDPVTTWQREMREELGIALERGRIVLLWNHDAAGRRRFIFYYEWPSLASRFALGEGQGYAWFTLAEALGLPNLTDLARNDLVRFGHCMTLLAKSATA